MSKFYWINDNVCIDVRRFYKYRIERTNQFYRIIGILENHKENILGSVKTLDEAKAKIEELTNGAGIA